MAVLTHRQFEWRQRIVDLNEHGIKEKKNNFFTLKSVLIKNIEIILKIRSYIDRTWNGIFVFSARPWTSLTLAWNCSPEISMFLKIFPVQTDQQYILWCIKNRAKKIKVTNLTYGENECVNLKYRNCLLILNLSVYTF